MTGWGLISVDKSRPLLTNFGHKKLIPGPRSGDLVAIHATGQKPARSLPIVARTPHHSRLAPGLIQPNGMTGAWV